MQKRTSKPKPVKPRKLMPLRYDNERVDPWLRAIMVKVAADPVYAATRVSMATVQRMALDAGVEVLAKRYGVKLE